MTHLEMKVLHPNEHGDWLNQRNESFGKWMQIEPAKKFDEKSKSWFVTNAVGVSSGRDSWVYGFGKETVANNMQKMIHFYNSETKKFHNNEIQDLSLAPTQISWTRALKKDAEKDVKHKFEESTFVVGLYRPYCKQNLYYHRPFIESPGLWKQLFPTKDSENLVICVSGVGSSKNFTPLIANVIPCYDFVEKAQCFPLYYYEELDSSDMFASNEKYVRKDAVSDYILKQARSQYNDPKIRKEDIFYYVYGFLHSEEYRTEFSADLKKMLPRIPLIDSAEDFWAFSKAGRKLADIHLNYETVKPYEASIVPTNLPMAASNNSDARDLYKDVAPEQLYRVVQMKFDKFKGKEKDKSKIIYNERLSIANIPEDAYKYVVNGKSAIEWLMERYAITTDSESGIVKDPNEWACEHNNPSYIFDLVLRLITVSLETVEIVKTLPKLKF